MLRNSIVSWRLLAPALVSLFCIGLTTGCDTSLGVDENLFQCDPSAAGEAGGTGCLPGYICLRVSGTSQTAHCVLQAEIDCELYPCDVMGPDAIDMTDMESDGETCPGEQTLCGGRCVDINTSTTNCGSCGTSCQPGEDCQSGLCRCNGQSECNEGEGCCGGTCQPLNSEDCVCGEAPCDSGFSCCDESCVAFEVDEQNCGGCGVVCPVNTECQGGACLCNNERCPAVAENSDGSSCTNGECLLSCVDDFVDCNDDASDGCESDLSTDVNNCGMCNARCGETASSCVLGECDPIVQISSSASTTCIRRQSGNVACWGGGQVVGQSDSTPQPTPTLVSVDDGHLDNAVYIDLWLETGCAILSNGEIVCWGGHKFGMPIESQSTPFVPFTGWPTEASPEQVAVGGELDQVFVCALADDLTVWCSGDNTYGILGTGAGSASESWVKIDFPAGQEPTAIFTGSRHACAIAGNDQQLYCWGDNNRNQLGDDTVLPSPIPKAVPGMDKVTRAGLGQIHTCAARVDPGVANEVWCWGGDDRGQVATTGPATTPRMILDTVTAVDISAGRYHTCIRNLDDEVLCWGRNNLGQTTGDGTSSMVSGVVTVPMLSADNVATGDFTTCVLEVDGGAACWGAGDTFRLGNGGTETSLFPVPVSNLP